MLAGTLIYGFSQIRFSWHLKTFVLLVRYSAPLGIGGLGFLIIHYGRPVRSAALRLVGPGGDLCTGL